MSNLALSPESLDIATAYIEYGSAKETAYQLQIPEHQVIELLERKDVKDYINGIYLDRGYRNRHKIGQVLDRMIESKLEEAEESGIYTSKDLFDLITLAHKMRIDELKAPQQGTTVNIANIGNYGQLMERLLDKGDK